jgi:hypothetical protein
MATTTNYSWTTPDDTDLVKDGAAAIRTLGSSADTTVKDLNPGTTAGDIDYYTSSTAKARVAIGTAGQVLKVNGGGTAPEWATTADQTPLTTKGDLFTFDTADARLGVGANGTVLTANSSEATGLEWAAPAGGGGMTLLSTTTLSGATVTISGIDQTYTQLFMTIEGVTNASADGAFRINPNGADTVQQITINGNNNTVTTASDYGGKITTVASLSRANVGNGLSCLITNYASTSGRKAFLFYGGFINTASAFGMVNAGGYINTTGALTSLVFSNAGGNLSAGTVYLYGVK